MIYQVLRLIGLIFLVVTGVVGAHAQVLFEEVAVQAGIEHMHLTNSNIGGGVAVFDYDNDGWLDLFLTGGEAQDKLYRNLGGFQFQDVSVSSGIANLTPVKSFGVTTGDIDNDGYRDILVTGERCNSTLLHNQGDGTFDALSSPIMDGDTWKSAATFGDVNLDGFLDLYIGSYVDTISFVFDNQGNVIGFTHRCSPNFLFINNGDLSFTDASQQYQVADTGCALAVAFTDFDSDADPDLFCTNDFGQWVVPSTVFENRPDQGQLVDVGQTLQLDYQMYGMGIAIGDFDRDADLDYYQTNLGRNVLSRNDGMVFTDITTSAGVESDSIGDKLQTGWGTFFFDADNNGWPDLFVANGTIQAAQIIATVEQDSNRLFINNGDQTFTDISATAQIGSIERSRGAAFGDFDNDGKLDFVVNNVAKWPDSTRVELYRNISDNTGNWIAFNLTGTASNRDAFGAQVRIYVNGSATLAEVDGGSSHASQSMSRIHFGLGTATMVDSVVVRFPAGTERRFTSLSSGQVVQVVEDMTVGVPHQFPSDNGLRLVYREGMPQFHSRTDETVILELFDVSGKRIHGTELSLKVGFNRVGVFQSLSQGCYIIRIIDDHSGPKTYKILNKGSSY